MKRWKTQETLFSCGPSALRNCLLFLGIERTEKYIRFLMNTTKKGTSEKGIIQAITAFKLDYKVHYSRNFERFRFLLLKALRKKNPCIVLIDACNHWVAAIDYNKQKVSIIDSEFKKILQPIPMKTLKPLAYNFDKHESKGYYYFIELITPLVQ